MDDRTPDRTHEIKEGAGLDESRLNQDFIDALRKWSSPVLFILAGLMGVYALTQHLERREDERVNQAFLEFSQIAEGANPSPASLKALASEYSDVGSIPTMAKLIEADMYMNSVMTGLMPGAQIDPVTREAQDENDIVTDEKRQTLLSDAEGLYQEVIREADGSKAKGPMMIGAMFGVASVAEAKNDASGARSMYERIATKAEEIGFPEYAGIASDRIANLDEVIAFGGLPSRADLPQEEVPAEETPADAGPIGPELIDPNQPIDLNPAPEDDGAEADEDGAADDGEG